MDIIATISIAKDIATINASNIVIGFSTSPHEGVVQLNKIITAHGLRVHYNRLMGYFQYFLIAS